MARIGNFFFRYRNGLFPVMLALLFVDSRDVFPRNEVAATVGIAIALLGQGLRAITIGLDYIIRGGRARQVYAKELVQGGVFAHCRNPLYVGNLLVILGLGFVANEWLFLLVGMPFFLFAYRCIVAAEENFLRQKFGAEYDDYCQRVGRFLPNFTGFARTWQSMEFKWRRLIVKEYGSTYIWMATACALMIQNHRAGGASFSEPVTWVLCATLVMLTLLYCTARFLKKTRLLMAEQSLPVAGRALH